MNTRIADQGFEAQPRLAQNKFKFRDPYGNNGE
jgi:hypothetical protein